MQNEGDHSQTAQIIHPLGANQPAEATPDEPNLASTANDDAITWSASEFIAHEKNAGWYMILAAVALVTAGAIYLSSRDLISSVVVVIVAVLFGYSASRQPRTLQYTVNEKGITIGTKFYGYELFKSFSVLQDGAFSSIVLMPLRRFMPSISIYYPPEHENDIADVLGDFLPHETRKLDPLDNLMRKVRF